MFVTTEHGTTLMDELIREMQQQMLNGEYNHLALQELTIIVNDMRDKYENMSEDEKLIETARGVFLKTCQPMDTDFEYIKHITGDMKVHDILNGLDACNGIINSFFEELEYTVGSQIREIINYDDSNWYKPEYNKNCTLNEILGITRKMKVQKQAHEVKDEVLESILEDLTGACVETNSIQRYNLFNSIEQHMTKLREQYKSNDD